MAVRRPPPGQPFGRVAHRDGRFARRRHVYAPKPGGGPSRDSITVLISPGSGGRPRSAIEKTVSPSRTTSNRSSAVGTRLTPASSLGPLIEDLARQRQCRCPEAAAVAEVDLELVSGRIGGHGRSFQNRVGQGWCGGDFRLGATCCIHRTTPLTRLAAALRTSPTRHEQVGMKPPDFEYARPTTIADAVSALAASGGEGKVLAGGQSLVPLLNFRLASPGLLVDLNRIAELSHITLEGNVLRVGSMTRMRALETDPTVAQRFPLLAAAAHWVGHVQIRNRGTVGGSLAHADPAAEVPAVALLVDAELVAAGPEGERRIPADEFFQGFLFTALAEDEILTEVRFPLPATGSRWGFREFAHRRGDFALAGAAVLLPVAANAASDADGAADTRIVVFGTSDRPRRSERAEAALAGRERRLGRLRGCRRLAAEDAAADDPRPGRRLPQADHRDHGAPCPRGRRTRGDRMTTSATLPITLRVNGVEHRADVAPRLLLSDFLRHSLHLTGTHVGCEHGVCGACTVWSTGRASARA